MFGCSQLPPTGCKYSGIPESSPHRCPTHILSHNHYHRMGICEETEGQKSQKTTLIPTQSTFRCFYDLNFGPTVSNMEIFRTHVHAGTSHCFSYYTPNVFLGQWGCDLCFASIPLLNSLDFMDHPLFSLEHVPFPPRQVGVVYTKNRRILTQDLWARMTTVGVYSGVLIPT
jgi:hypothetical protein